MQVRVVLRYVGSGGMQGRIVEESLGGGGWNVEHNGKQTANVSGRLYASPVCPLRIVRPCHGRPAWSQGTASDGSRVCQATSCASRGTMRS